MSRRAPLRILHILPTMQGYGAERQIMQLLPRLQSQDTTAALLTVYAPRDEQRQAVTFPVLDASRASGRDFTFIVRLVEKIRSFRPDVVHTHMHVGKYWGRFAAVAAGVRTIVHTEHNPCDPRRSLLDRLADRTLGPHTTRYLTFFSEQTRMVTQLDGLEPSKVQIIPNGLDFAQIPLHDRNEARALLDLSLDDSVVLVIGRMMFQKNHDLALRALSAIPEDRRRNVVLLFAGSGELEVELRELAVSLGVWRNTRFLGYRTDVPQILAASDLLLMTSRFEGMPLALLEGMHAGIPILTTPWTGSRSMLGDGKYARISASWDVADLSSELMRALIEQKEMRAMASSAKEFVETEFTLERMALAHRNFYLDLCSTQEEAA